MEGGVVYSIAPPDKCALVKRVHRTMLNSIIQHGQVPDILPLYSSPCMGSETLRSEDIGNEEEMEDGQWICVPLPEGTPPAIGPVPAVSTLGHVESVVGPLHSDGWQEASGSGVNFPCRSAREIAGTHSNLHHLPRAVGISTNGAATSLLGHSEGVTVVFRPWIKVS